MSTAHKNLSGTALHENKGVATADDDTVATASGGATVWAKLTADNLTGTGNPFGGQLFTATATVAQSLHSSTWNTLLLNTTETNEITDASLASNLVSLPAGTCFYDVVVQLPSTGQWVCRLYNSTDSSTIKVGSYGNAASVGITRVYGRFTIAGTKSIALQANGSATGTPGDAVSASPTYAQLSIWKVA